MAFDHNQFCDPWGMPNPRILAYAGFESALEAVETAQELMVGRRSGHPLTMEEAHWLGQLRFIAVEAKSSLDQLVDDWREEQEDEQLAAAREYAMTARYEALRLQLMARATPEAFAQEARQAAAKNDAIYAAELKAGRIYGRNADGSKKA